MTLVSILIVVGLMLICVVMSFIVTRMHFGPIVTVGKDDVTPRIMNLQNEILLLRSTAETLKILSRCDEVVASRFDRFLDQLDGMVVAADLSLEEETWDHAHAVAMRGLSLIAYFKELLQTAGLTQITFWLLNGHNAEPVVVRYTKPSEHQMKNRKRLLWTMSFEKWR